MSEKKGERLQPCCYGRRLASLLHRAGVGRRVAGNKHVEPRPSQPMFVLATARAPDCVSARESALRGESLAPSTIRGQTDAQDQLVCSRSGLKLAMPSKVEHCRRRQPA